MQGIGINRKLLEVLHALRLLSDLFTKFMDALPPPVREEKWLRDSDIIEIFKVTGRTIYNWKKKGDLTVKYMGGTAYYRESDVYKRGKN